MTFKDKIFISIGTAAVITTIGAGGYLIIDGNNASQNNQVADIKNTNVTTEVTATTDSTPIQNTTTTTETATSNKYKDGTYTASANYYVPKYQNSISVNITIENDTIKSVSASHDYTDRESGMYIDSFDSQISSKVVGKAIGDINLSRIGGASLTTYGFNDALDAALKNATI